MAKKLFICYHVKQEEIDEVIEMRAKHSKLFYQYLLSYILILLIPFLGLSVFVGGYMLHVLKEEIHENNMNTLQNAKNVVEAQLQSITSTEHKLYLSGLLDGFLLEDDTITAIDTREKLKAYCQMNPFLIDAAYYQEEDAYIIAASSSCPKEEFWDTMYSFEHWDYESFKRELENSNKEAYFLEAQQVCVRKAGDQRIGTSNYESIVTLVLPLDVSGKRCVILLMNEDFFTSAMPMPDMEREVSAIVDDNGHIIVSKGNAELLNTAAMQQLQENMEAVTINGEKYQISSVYSEEYHWTYETLVLIGNIEKEAVYMRLLMLFTCLLTGLAGAVVICYFMKKNYSPLHTLEIASNEILKNEENKSELDHVKTVLDYLNSQNQRLQAEDEERKDALKERFVSKWLSGQYSDVAQIREHAQAVGIKLQRSFYQAAVLHICRGRLAQRSRIEEILLNTASDNMDIFIRVQTETERIFLVAGYDEDMKSAVEQYFKECIQRIQKEIDSKSCLAVGMPVYQDIRLRKSYKEAMKALEYRVILDDAAILRYEEMEAWKGSDVADIQPRRLEGYVRNRDAEGLDTFLDMALKEMKSRKTDIRQIHMLCNEFIYALQKTINSVNRDYFIDEPLCDRIKGILEYDTVSELMQLLRLISYDIIEHLKEQTDKSAKEELLSYIAENGFSVDFSTKAMAEEFDMSLTSLSKYFKKHIGINLSDYVTELRINKAKELLLYEDKPVRAVAEEVGYSSVNSFDRRFKQVSGFTPKEWRMQKS